MNLSLNYFLEANLALCIFLIVYIFLFRKETNFTLKRIILLTGIGISLLFPAFHIQESPLHLPTFAEVLPPKLLPEFVVVGNSGNQESLIPTINLPGLIYYVYLGGVTLMLIVFLYRMSTLLLFIFRAERKAQGNLQIAESRRNTAPFSFFNFIYIGQSDQLTDHEKKLIIAHEAVHAKQWHTMDILFLEMLRIVFWFNPVLNIYKNIFTQLHEFEADARSVKNEDLGAYCNLVARVALLSADIRIANHFSNSLTLKRIQMMRTIKLKIRLWKVAVMLLTFPAFFILLACQDQLANPDTTEDLASAKDLPQEVQSKYDELVNANPDLKIFLMELSQSKEDYAKLEEIQKDIDSKGTINSVNLVTPTAKESEPIRHFIIIQYNEDGAAQSNASGEPAMDASLSMEQENVYTVVDQTATPSGGIETFYGFLAKNISYPAQAREKGLQGKVFVSFIVEPDGSLSDLKIAKGVSDDLNAEALRVVKLSPKWNPAKHEGAIVRQRMVLPINFKIDETKSDKVGYFSTPLNPVEFLHPDNQHKC